MPHTQAAQVAATTTTESPLYPETAPILKATGRWWFDRLELSTEERHFRKEFTQAFCVNFQDTLRERLSQTHGKSATLIIIERGNWVLQLRRTIEALSLHDHPFDPLLPCVRDWPSGCVTFIRRSQDAVMVSGYGPNSPFQQGVYPKLRLRR